MDVHDRRLLAGLAKVNTEIGRVTVELLTLQPDDAAYADGLRTLGRQLVGIGAELAARAGQLDGLQPKPHELLTTAEPPDEPS
ncbi:hypothetical protein QRX60_17085 [Amycolatopsis mongoliensis]|uniref:Uncharacterized protein n=1 Tax=Amycolatopsis mongoliensis TaxID=715475 RepID=A0A9Y2NKW3_9PSEU|nr:hypothetical protein [Amycolatopsis sp. 4-36]WIY05474.1 hypothetical protein QRX60_17085 [Amycolatopsis sp. 4-36]